MPAPLAKPSAQRLYERSRQKVILLVFAGVLMVGVILVLFVLKRMPLPMRLVIGLGDVIAASALLLILRQKYGGK